MSAFFNHPLGEWIVFVLAVVAGIIALKYVVSFLPDGGFPGAFKAVIQAA